MYKIKFLIIGKNYFVKSLEFILLRKYTKLQTVLTDLKIEITNTRVGKMQRGGGGGESSILTA